MGVILYSHGNKTRFHNKGCALSVILEVTVFGTQKWSIDHSIIGDGRWGGKFRSFISCGVFMLSS